MQRFFRCATAVLLLGCGAAAAQQAGTGAPADGGTTEVLQSIYIPPKTDAPFTLTLATEWDRLTGDGDTTTLTNRRLIARDSRGRIMEERRLLTPPHGDEQTMLTYIQIADPEQHTLYNCRPAARLCQLYTYADRPGKAEVPEGSTMYPGAEVTTKDLGRDIKAGLEVHGTRVTTVIAPGMLGNSRPITVKREFWFSDALGFNVVSKRKDPRFGDQTFTVTQLNRDEPDPALFAVPPNYQIVDERMKPQR
jgi:hypothetical protein